MRYDLVVIGGGPSGEKAAAAAAFFDKKVALVEKADAGPGGAAVHTGTLPSKTLRETALYKTGFQRRELYKTLADPYAGDPGACPLGELMCRLPQVRETQSRQIADNLERHGIELVRGSGVLIDAHRFEVDGRVLEADHFIIATGSRPRMPGSFAFGDPEVYDSDTLLRLDRMPASLGVIGGGVIGSEYACVFAALGVKIEIIEMRPRLLSFLDHEISDAIAAAMREAGIVLHLDNAVKVLERDGVDLRLELGDGTVKHFDKVLVSAGRTGNSNDLGLEGVGVEIDERGNIVVDEHFRTAAPHIYAVGDVIGRPALASSGMEQGRMAVAYMFDIEVPKRDWAVLPAGIYTIPEAASVGPTQQELEADGVPFVTGKSFMHHNARGQIIGDTDGFVKLLFHAETKRLLGVHMLCERATELIHIGQAVMRLGGGVDYFLESVMTYPSLSQAFKYAAYDALGKLAKGGDRPPPLRFIAD